MTRVDFYVLDDNARLDDATLTCRLCAKAFEQGQRLFVYAADGDDARHLDELLWVFSDTAFVPHALADTDEAAAAPVLIGAGDPPAEHLELMINRRHPVPGVFSRFERVIEIVPAGDGRDAARERFRFYRERGYELNTHDIR